MPACHAGGPGSIPGRCSSMFGIWREVLRRNVYIMSQYITCIHYVPVLGRNVYITYQYFFPAIIYRDIISRITITYRYIMYFFKTFKKSTAPYKVHNMGLRYIKTNMVGHVKTRTYFVMNKEYFFFISKLEYSLKDKISCTLNGVQYNILYGVGIFYTK